MFYSLFPVDVSVSSDLPIGAGLGSSASYSISLVAAMLTAQGFITPLKTVSNTTRTHSNQSPQIKTCDMQSEQDSITLLTTNRTQIDHSNNCNSQHLYEEQESNNCSLQTLCNWKGPQNEESNIMNDLEIECKMKKAKYEQSDSTIITTDNSFSAETLSVIVGWAYEAEKLMHGKPSGIDNSIGTLGELEIVSYRIIIVLKEHLKTISNSS